MVPESKRADYIERLQKRLNWLRKRVEKGEREGQDLTYDKAEAGALDWAIRELSAPKAGAK